MSPVTQKWSIPSGGEVVSSIIPVNVPSTFIWKLHYAMLCLLSYKYYEVISEPGSSVNIVNGYGMGNQGLIPVIGRGFSSSLWIQTGSGAHPSVQCVTGSFSGGKAQLVHAADHSPLLVPRLWMNMSYTSSPLRVNIGM